MKASHSSIPSHLGQFSASQLYDLPSQLLFIFFHLLNRLLWFMQSVFFPSIAWDTFGSR